MKRITLVLTMLMTVSSLSGCIVAPHRWHDGDRDRHDHRDNDRCDSRYHYCGRNWRH